MVVSAPRQEGQKYVMPRPSTGVLTRIVRLWRRYPCIPKLRQFIPFAEQTQSIAPDAVFPGDRSTDRWVRPLIDLLGH